MRSFATLCVQVDLVHAGEAAMRTWRTTHFAVLCCAVLCHGLGGVTVRTSHQHKPSVSIQKTVWVSCPPVRDAVPCCAMLCGVPQPADYHFPTVCAVHEVICEGV